MARPMRLVGLRMAESPDTPFDFLPASLVHGHLPLFHILFVWSSLKGPYSSRTKLLYKGAGKLCCWPHSQCHPYNKAPLPISPSKEELVEAGLEVIGRQKGTAYRSCTGLSV